MTEQVEFCDVIVLNKISTISEDDKKRIRAILVGLNPMAEIIETDFGRVDFDKIIDTGKFDKEKAEEAPLWVQELKSGGHHHHTPETEEYGIKSFIYRAFKPFHPNRFLDFVNEEWPGVIRSKGIFWIASRNNWAFSWSQAGGSVNVDPAGRWAASFLENELKNFPEISEELAEYKSFPYGDRRQELVIISIEDNEEYIKNRLNSCLLTDEEMREGPEVWKNYVDNFPQWNGI